MSESNLLKAITELNRIADRHTDVIDQLELDIRELSERLEALDYSLQSLRNTIHDLYDQVSTLSYQVHTR